MDMAQVSSELGSEDPETGLRAVQALRRLAEQVEAKQVAAARSQGWSWQQIGEAPRYHPAVGASQIRTGRAPLNSRGTHVTPEQAGDQRC